MKIVTSGAPFIDIDAYACMVAYAELLNRQNIPAIAFTTSEYNETITKTVLGWAVLPRNVRFQAEDTFIVVDASNPRSMERRVTINRLEKVIDHRYEFLDAWHATEVELILEKIGAAATYIYEQWQKAGLTSVMSLSSARLLYTAIIDNTLDLHSKVTTTRDKEAYEHLRKLANLSDEWPQKYFEEAEKTILTDVKAAISKDTKVYNSPNVSNPITFMQLCVWDMNTCSQAILDSLSSESKMQTPWLINVIAVKQNRSFFVADSVTTTDWLNESLGLKKTGKNTYMAKRMYLRKEIIEKDIKRANK